MAAAAVATSDDEEIEAGNKIGGAAPGGRVAVLVGYGPRMTEAKRRPRKGGTATPAPVATSVPAATAVPVGQVAGSGQGGIVTRADLEAYTTGGFGLAGQAAGAVTTPAADGGAGSTAYSAPVFAASGEREVRIPIAGVRKMTAQAMVGRHSPRRM